ncbi:hypothetical protein E8E13_011598 [Curvularia kusanoi]|uniref:Uncharacterized protein n=1 Tax=Curvularia kusanoi TaxID=90978 RepID=A0A9P4TPB0_CURKU|nr:hypothetical protein E8E13_011598 [Curvularia kusanoi]
MSRVALITAGSNGVGAAIAKTLALEANMSVVINFHSNSERAEALVRHLDETAAGNNIGGMSSKPRFAAIQADMGKQEEISRLVDETVALMGSLDVVVSNAGWTRITNFANLEEADEESWNRCFNMNVKSHFFLFKRCKQYLDESCGAFIATASVAGVLPSGSSLDWGLQFSEDKLSAVREKNALKRFATAEDVAQQVKCLASSQSMTGTNIVIDAGFSL